MRKAMRIEFERSRDAFEDSSSSACLCKISVARKSPETFRRRGTRRALVTFLNKFNAFWKRLYNDEHGTSITMFVAVAVCNLRFLDRHKDASRSSEMIEQRAREAAVFLFSPKINKKKFFRMSIWVDGVW